MLAVSIWVWIALDTPFKYPNSVLSTEPSCIRLAFNLLDVSIVACLASNCVWALDDKVLINWNSVLVTLPSAILVASIAAADLILAFSILVILLPLPSVSIVLLLNVFVLNAYTSSFKVTEPDAPPPVNPVPATTSVISPIGTFAISLST